MSPNSPRATSSRQRTALRIGAPVRNADPGGRPDDQGTLPAIVNAAYHATGNRVRDLPLTPDTFVE